MNSRLRYSSLSILIGGSVEEQRSMDFTGEQLPYRRTIQ